MKKYLSFMLIGLVLIAIIFSSGYAYFTFSNEIVVENISGSSNNAKFNKTESDFYKVYFFASPYYATGATIDGIDITDPLKIADSGSKNPYNQDEGYLLIGSPITGNNADKYANAIYPDKGKHYLSAESIDNEKLGTYGAVKMWPKKYWTGYILDNPNYGIYEKTSTYVSLTVNTNIPSDVLDDFIAQTVYKDRYGFGPEFIGWTYDMASCNTRVRYGTKRYNKDDSMKLGDTRGWGNGNGDQIGNYGVQGEIEQISSSTSLYYIDNLASANSTTTSIDGSLKGDHIIYLYPVFMAKNYSKDKIINNKQTALLKFRVNPEKDEQGNYTYEYKQSGEIDYSKKRYTNGFFQTSDTDILKPNYYVDDIYINTSNSEDNDIKDMILDINPLNKNNVWSSNWETILNFDDLKKLNLAKGFYNFYISFWQIDENTFNENDETEKVLKVMEEFNQTNLYMKIIGSKRQDGVTYGATNLIADSAHLHMGYVIAIQKNEEFRITGNSLNGSINDFNSANQKKLYHTSIIDKSNKFFSSDNIYLKKNDEISILIENTTIETIPYSFTTIDETLLDEYNTALAQSTNANKTPFKNVGDEKIKINDKTNKIFCKASGTYDFMFVIDFINGIPKSVGVSYRELNENCNILILSSKPNENMFFDYKKLEESTEFVASGTFNLYSSIAETSILFDKQGNALNIKQIHEMYPNMILIDTATGWEIKYSLFETNKFILNRNYVLYLKSNN